MYLEHANITVSDLDATVEFYKTAFPSFKIRGGGTQPLEGGGFKRWLHFGTDETYVALSELPLEKQPEKDYDKNGFNHIGFVVEDVNALAARMEEKGYKHTYPRQEEKYRIREYFGDPDGNEIEFVQYLSDNWAERNAYE